MIINDNQFQKTNQLVLKTKLPATKMSNPNAKKLPSMVEVTSTTIITPTSSLSVGKLPSMVEVTSTTIYQKPHQQHVRWEVAQHDGGDQHH